MAVAAASGKESSPTVPILFLYLFIDIGEEVQFTAIDSRYMVVLQFLRVQLRCGFDYSQTLCERKCC